MKTTITCLIWASLLFVANGNSLLPAENKAYTPPILTDKQKLAISLAVLKEKEAEILLYQAQKDLIAAQTEMVALSKELCGDKSVPEKSPTDGVVCVEVPKGVNK